MTKQEMQEFGYHSILLDCYRYLQQFGKVIDNDAFWSDAATAASGLSRKYAGTPVEKLTNALLLAIYDELENVRKRGLKQ